MKIDKETQDQISKEHFSPIHPRTVFDVGSIAKQFVGMAIALLEEDGRIESFVYRDYDGDGREAIKFDKVDR